MTTKPTLKRSIDMLRDEMRDAFRDAYKANVTDWDCLRDYARDISYDRNLRAMLQRETENERQHRRFAPDGFKAPISHETASKLILMGNVVDGASKDAEIPASWFLTYRQTACEAMVLGWIAREYLSEDWRARVKAFDYAKIMAA